MYHYITVRSCMHCTKKGVCPTLPGDHNIVLLNIESEKKSQTFILCLLSLGNNPHASSTTLNFPSLPSAEANFSQIFQVHLSKYRQMQI